MNWFTRRPGPTKGDDPVDEAAASSPRKAMDEALNKVAVEVLRERGFTGSLPHLRRRSTDRISLLSVQHYSSGGSFVVEVARCPPEGITTSWGEEIRTSKVTAQDVNTPRPRLGSAEFPGFGDHWFVYGKPNYERNSQTVKKRAHYEAVAAQVLALIDAQAEPFWQAEPDHEAATPNAAE